MTRANASSLEHFGASAAYQTLYEEFGITAERVAAAARTSLARVAGGQREIEQRVGTTRSSTHDPTA